MIMFLASLVNSRMEEQYSISSTNWDALISVTRLLRKLKLRPRTESGDGGLFAYHEAKSDLLLIFRWDGAGLTNSGRIVLFEQEVPGFQPLHIQGHLTRLLFMIRSGDAVAKLV